MTTRPTCYLGDAVYVSLEEYGDLVLTTGDHDEAKATNRIVLEPQVYRALLAFVEGPVANYYHKQEEERVA